MQTLDPRPGLTRGNCSWAEPDLRFTGLCGCCATQARLPTVVC